MVFKTHPNEAFILQELLIHHLLTSQSRLQNVHRLEFTSTRGKLAVCCFWGNWWKVVSPVPERRLKL